MIKYTKHCLINLIALMLFLNIVNAQEIVVTANRANVFECNEQEHDFQNCVDAQNPALDAALESDDNDVYEALLAGVTSQCRADARRTQCPPVPENNADSVALPNTMPRTLTGDGAPATTRTLSNSGSPVSEVEDLNAQLEQCQAKLKQTETCCNNPMSCLTNDGSDSTRTNGVFMALQIAAGSATQTASLAGSCGTLGNISTGMAAINTALAFKCSQKIAQCNSVCGNIGKRAKEVARSCRGKGDDCATNSDIELTICPTSDDVKDPNSKLTMYDVAKCEQENKKERKRKSEWVVSELSRIAKEADGCDEYGGRAVEQQSQAIASLYAAKIAGLCKKQSTTDPNSSVANNAFNVNCSDPTNAANPVCQNQCNRANAANDPVCAQLLGLGTSGFGTGNGTGGNLADASATGAGSGSIDEFEDAQSMLDANIQAVGSKANVGGGGGSGGVPSGASSSGGADGGAAGGGDGGSGLNTGILGGTKSGSGYSQPFVRSSMGGGGYSASGGGGRGVASEGKPFNPRDFLPGGKMDPKRKLAGLASASPEIGAVHGNIFTNITNRFLQVCLRDGLFDCETLRKNSRPRN
jgi:hypothetical protein